MAKNLSPIGFMMDLLDISVQQIAQYLFIDRTTISKWRTGTRKLSERSPYFEKLAFLFAQKNHLLGNHPLTALFSDLYPDSPARSEEEVAALVKKYMREEGSSRIVDQFVHDMQKALYQSQVSVFRGSEGRKSAIKMILDIAEVSTTPCHIKMFELDSFEWLNGDLSFIQSFLRKLDHLTQLGHTVEFSYTPGSGNVSFKTFIRSLSTLFYNKNVRINLVEMDDHIYILPCIYGIDGKCVTIGVNYEKNMQNMHTVIHFDQFTVNKYLMIHDKMVELHTHPFHITSDEREKDKILQFMQFARVKKEPAYYYGRSLTIATMSEEMLMTILEQNHLTVSEKNRCVLLYQILRSSLASSPGDSFGGLYLDLGAIIETISYDMIVQYELSAFSRRSIIMTKEQYLQHLTETADFLTSHSNIKAKAVQGIEFDVNIVSTWIKRNLWCMALNRFSVPEQHQVIFVDDVPIVNASADLCEEKMGQYPIKYKNSEYIISLLERLGRGEDV